jgi:HlyD family secretion protein
MRMKKFIKKILSIFLLVAAAACAGGTIYYYQIPEANFVSVTRGSLSETVEETGYVKTAESYDIQAPSAGRVVRLDAAIGREVKAGQSILVLQNISTETQLNEIAENIRAATADRDKAKTLINNAKNDLEEARKELESSASLYKAGAISRIEHETFEKNLRKTRDAILPLESGLEAAEHRLLALRSQQNGISAQVSQLSVVSPINARILSLPVKNGQVVPSGAILASVGSGGTAEVYTEILSDAIVRLHPGQPVDIFLGTGNEKMLAGHIKQIYPQAVEKPSPLGVLQRRVPILIALDENGPLKPGYEVSLSIRIASRKNILLVPRESVSVNKSGNEYVKTLRIGRAKVYSVLEREIVTGLKNPYYAEVLQGLHEGELLIRDGSLPIKNGSWVRSAKEQ